jgi:acetyl-CoA C-acetyltransferase
MALDPRTPVLVGCGQFLQRPDDPRAASFDTAADPATLMVEAIRLAAADAGLSTVPNVDALRVVALLSWKYGNPAWFVARNLGITAKQYGVSANGGNTPQTLVNSAALDIQSGRADIIILTGGEAWRTKQRAKKAGHVLTWPKADSSTPAPDAVSDDLSMAGEQEIVRRIVMPVQVYPMFETAIRARAGRSVPDQQAFISDLWSRFSKVAAKNPYAWSQRELSAEEIRTSSASNRMIGFPYPKYMNSNNDVDMGAALIMCSAEKAQSLGIPHDRWVFINSGSDCHEHQYISNRWTFAETPAIELGGKRALELAGLGIGDIDIVDLYSCFPSAVQLGAQSLGLDINSQLTCTGGLPFAGGPWNNYVMHAIATVMNGLRERSGAKGLVWANGGYTTKHAFGIYSTEPPAVAFRHAYPQDEIDAMPRRDVATIDEAVGATATIEAYSVMHGRDGSPEMIHAACLLADGRRAWGESTDVSLGREMCADEFVGYRVEFDAKGVFHIA